MTKKERWIVFPVGIALLFIATLFDLQISLAVYGKNLFSAVFEIVGEIPITFLALLGAVILLRSRSKKNKAVNIALAAAYSLLAALFAFMLGFMTTNYINENIARALPSFVPVIIGAAGLVGAILLARGISEENARAAVTFAILAVVYLLLIVIVMNALKSVWGRMRMREMTDPLSQFTPWYIITSRGGFDNRYASFPSGHSMNSAGVILLLMLPPFMPKLRGREKLLRGVAYAWALVVGFSRVVAGAHFSTDVIAGILLSLMLFEAARAVITKLRAKTAMEVEQHG